jgi:hypothetical protein
MNEFDDLDDLDEVLGPLRSVARPAELSQERVMVDLMVNAHRTAEGKRMFTSRRARVATLVAAGVLGFGGMAAASPSLGGGSSEPTFEPMIVQQEEPPTGTVEPEPTDTVEPEPTDTVEPEPTDTVEPEPTDTVEPEPTDTVEPEEEKVEPESDAVPIDDPTTGFFNELNCAEGNHGKTVSAVARGDSDFLEKYAMDNGGTTPSVNDAARSSCGKTDRDEGDAEMEIESEVESAESEKSEPKAQRPGRSDRGAERSSNGNGNGNGKRGG